MPNEIAPGASTPFTSEGARASWGPLVDGDILPAAPTTAGNKVPAIFGFNAAEGALFVFGDYLTDSFSLNQSVYDEFLTYNFGPLASKVNQTYSVDKFNSSSAPYFAAISTVLGEVSYKCPAYRALVKSQQLGIPAWTYEFSHTPSCAWYAAIPDAILKYVGATHTAEIPFVFNMTHNLPPPDGNCTFTAKEQALSASMSQAWTNMAEFGSPGDASVWPQWTRNSSAGVTIDDSMVVGTVDYTSCLFWDAINEASIKIAGNC
jgi:carboxylesterase type B